MWSWKGQEIMHTCPVLGAGDGSQTPCALKALVLNPQHLRGVPVKVLASASCGVIVAKDKSGIDSKTLSNGSGAGSR